MKAKGYEIKNAEFGENSRKYITFRSPDMSRPVRGSAKSLGKNFTKERIKERINNKLHRTTVPSVRNKLIDTNTPNIAGNIGLQKWANKENLKIVSAEYNKMLTHNPVSYTHLDVYKRQPAAYQPHLRKKPDVCQPAGKTPDR